MKAPTLVLSAILLVFGNAQADQIPFVSAQPKHSDWDLNALPVLNSTDNLIFDSVASLLQHWPNTRHRNGHAIVPGTVPVGTLLYHGTTSNKVPTIPEWTATDPEHSYLFCAAAPEADGCWHLTLVVTRPLKVLYFDGSSAAKMLGGPMDIQDFLTQGEPARHKGMYGERERLAALCDWGSKFGIDGYVRMEMDFEIMFCDLTAGMDVLSFLYLVNSSGGIGRHPKEPIRAGKFIPKLAPGQTHKGDFRSFEAVNSGSWHNYHPGDPRVVLDLTRYLSFYDISLAPSLVRLRANQTRGEYRLKGLAREDLARFWTALESVVSDPSPVSGSGIDWSSHVRVLMKRYTDRLELTARLLHSGDRSEAQAQKTFTQLRIMLTPYTLANAVPPNSTAATTGTSWAEPVYRLCSTTPVGFVSASADIFATLTSSEKLILRAIEGTNKEICRVLVRMWAQGVLAQIPIQPIEMAPTPKTVAATTVVLLDKWERDLDGLMSWLSWAVWVKCRPACSEDEICYLPTWPYIARSRPGQSEEELEREGTVLPEPKCIRRFAPYSQLPLQYFI